MKLQYHNHHLSLQRSLHNGQPWNLCILHRLRSYRLVQGIGTEVQSQGVFKKLQGHLRNPFIDLILHIAPGKNPQKYLGKVN